MATLLGEEAAVLLMAQHSPAADDAASELAEVQEPAEEEDCRVPCEASCVLFAAVLHSLLARRVLEDGDAAAWLTDFAMLRDAAARA